MENKTKGTFAELEAQAIADGYKTETLDRRVSVFTKPGKIAYVLYMGPGFGYELVTYDLKDSNPEVRIKLQMERQKIVGPESIIVEILSGTYYGYGSELVCLRLLKYFHHTGERAKAAYSENLKTWYFRLEPAA